MKATDIQTMIKVGVIVLIGAVDAVWISLSDFTIRFADLAMAGTLIVALFALSQFYRHVRRDESFYKVCEETALLIAFSLVAAVLSYLATSLDNPLIDQDLLAIDATLGFDWLGYVGVVNAHPWLGMLSSAVYVTTLAQVTGVVVWMSMTGRVADTQHFMTAVMLGALLCIGISAILPAAGALGTLRPSADFVMANAPTVDLAYKQTFFDLRSGALRVIDLADLKGLIAFPSYHGTLSALVAFAFLSLRRFALPAIILNGCVLLATPVDGGHHMIDVIGGVATAAFAWYLARRYAAWTERLCRNRIQDSGTFAQPARAQA